MDRIREGAGDVDLELAEAAGKGFERGGVELLAGEAQHAVAPERPEDQAEVLVGERAGEVETLEGGAEGVSGRPKVEHGRKCPRRAPERARRPGARRHILLRRRPKPSGARGAACGTNDSAWPGVDRGSETPYIDGAQCPLGPSPPSRAFKARTVFGDGPLGDSSTVEQRTLTPLI